LLFTCKMLAPATWKQHSNSSVWVKLARLKRGTSSQYHSKHARHCPLRFCPGSPVLAQPCLPCHSASSDQSHYRDVGFCLPTVLCRGGTAAKVTHSAPNCYEPKASIREIPALSRSTVPYPTLNCYKASPVRSLASSSFPCFNLHSPSYIHIRLARSYYKSNGPHIKDFVRLHCLKQLTDNFNTTSLTVNRTSLHPHGIQYV